ncbi:MAG: hypothetical protein IJV02_04385 [Candidatus Methanomethylophilaceae archaeon]|nr:hypothetical protein [Candidatus Methanomethylophilaceae archaeon]
MMLENLSRWKPHEIDAIIKAIQRHYIIGLKFRVESDNAVFVSVVIKFDWELQRMIVSEEGSSVRIKKKYVESMPEIEGLIDLVKSVSVETGIKINSILTYDTDFESEFWQLVPFGNRVELDDFTVTDNSNMRFKELNEMSANISSGYKDRYYETKLVLKFTNHHLFKKIDIKIRIIAGIRKKNSTNILTSYTIPHKGKVVELGFKWYSTCSDLTIDIMDKDFKVLKNYSLDLFDSDGKPFDLLKDSVEL